MRTKKNRSKLWAGLIVVALGIAGFAVNSSLTDRPVPLQDEAANTSVKAAGAKASSATNTAPTDNVGQPARLQIASLGIDAPIIPVGVTKQGDMAAPSDNATVGWYKHGALPGKPGRAVLDGHLNVKGKPAVFAKLDTIAIGERIVVTDVGGNSLTFVTTDKQIFKPETAPLERIFGESDQSLLTIITCEGTWHKETNTYSERLVVFAELQ